MKALADLRRNLARLRWLKERFGDLLHAERRLFALAVLALAGEILFGLLVPWPIKYVTDGLLLPNDSALWGVPAGFAEAHPLRFLLGVCGALIAVVLLGQWCAFHRKVWAATAGQNIVLKIRKRLFHHLQHLPLEYHDRSRQGDLLLRLTGDVPVLRDVLAESALELFGRLATVVVMVGVMLWLDPALACVSLAVLVVLGGLSGVFTRRITRTVRKQRKKESEVATSAAEALRAVKIVKAYGQEEEITRRFARRNRSSLRAGVKGTRLQAQLTRWVETLFALGTATVLGFGVHRYLSEASLSAGDLLLFLSYVRTLNKPLRQSARMSARIAKGTACGERLLEILATDREDVHESSRARAPAVVRDLRVRDLHFTHPGRERTLDGIDFSLAAGEHVALVGRNGAGKSTLVNLLLRFYEAESGAIELDGTSVVDYRRDSVRDLYTFVPQETLVLGETVRECLEFAAPDASEEAMAAALGEVGAGFVFDLEDGLDTALQEGGRGLSGGQLRKLALAGAVLRDRPIVVLDEPTTHVDEPTRFDLIERLPRLFAGRILLVITHDPELADRLARVLLLEQGRILASGPHRDLCRDSAEYRLLVSAPPERPEEVDS